MSMLALQAAGGVLRRWCAVWLLLFGSLLPAVAPWADEVAIPALTGRVLDRASALSAEQQRSLAAKLAALEQESGAQIAVLIVPTTGDDSIEQYAARAFETWKLGRKEVDDGILVVVAKDDRNMRIEVGYGLEGVVTDPRASRIIREQMAPRFAQGDFAGGLDAAADQLAVLVRTGELPAPAAAAESSGAGAEDGSWGGLGLLEGLILLVVLIFKAVPGPIAGIVIYFLTGNLWVALGAVVLVMALNQVLHRSQGAAVRRGGASRGGFSSGSWGSRSSGSGRSGGFRGGGGRSGGGGASGRW